jgi:hypothetical protein
MASTIVPTAAKRVTLRLPTIVGTEFKTIRLHVDADARLAAGVGGVARYLGDHAGLEDDAIAQLQKAVVAACQEAFESLTAVHPRLDVTLSRHIDRIEVALCYEGESTPAIGLDAIAGVVESGSGASDQPSVLGGVDRVQYETQGNIAVTRLTKYIIQGAPSR